MVVRTRYGMVVEERESEFGRWEVRDLAGFRSLTLNGQTQGAFWLEASDDGAVAGSIGRSVFTLGWLIAGACCPGGRMLMLGLGAGEGVVRLLDTFPELTVDVVERDEILIELALRHFPAVARHAESGRLRLLLNDAEAVVQSVGTSEYDALILDVASGDDSFQFSDEHTLLKAASEADATLWINAFCHPTSPHFYRLLELLASYGRQPTWAYSCLPQSGNQIVTDAEVDHDVLSTLELYRGVDSTPATRARNRFSLMLSERRSLIGVGESRGVRP